MANPHLAKVTYMLGDLYVWIDGMVRCQLKPARRQGVSRMFVGYILGDGKSKKWVALFLVHNAGSLHVSHCTCRAERAAGNGARSHQRAVCIARTHLDQAPDRCNAPGTATAMTAGGVAIMGRDGMQRRWQQQPPAFGLSAKCAA